MPINPLTNLPYTHAEISAEIAAGRAPLNPATTVGFTQAEVDAIFAPAETVTQAPAETVTQAPAETATQTPAETVADDARAPYEPSEPVNVFGDPVSITEVDPEAVGMAASFLAAGDYHNTLGALIYALTPSQ